ncbi:carbohydrate ABC transporter permease [Herbiconiux moechotypicola]|uniref:Carbohydrate ABC transporter permease n=1 Tax=Herbiconiux moechotypicola TaxID=637393 RepID=A0ABN3DAK1_9MICO|nr:carbohydrate ABC transporter permease [Herbiconiux moechotypicola]MCS5728996.1 carbohydrate ABC transporter permease [Herbiconiux moechotypicola]
MTRTESRPSPATAAFSGVDPDTIPRGRPRILPTAAWWVVAVCLAVLFLYPIWVMVSNVDVADLLKLTDASRGLSIFQSLGNSAFVSITATLVTLVASTFAGYAFAKLPYRGSTVAFFVILVTFMVPFQAVITPLYIVLRDIGLQNNLVGVALVIATFNLPLSTFLMRNSFAAIPSSLEEAAQIDGAGPFTAMWRIMLPVAVPGLVSATLLSFFAAWNDFFAALILITDQKLYTLPVSIGILSTDNQFGVDFGLMQTGVLITVIPCVIIYLVLQRYYVAGLLGGALK